MKNESSDDIKIKIAISLIKLLNSNKANSAVVVDEKSFAKSYNQISINTPLRKATISDIFNAKSDAYTKTLLIIIKEMGYSLSNFAIIYDAVTQNELEEFKEKKKSRKIDVS